MDRKERFKKLREIKTVRRPNPSSTKQLKAITDFADRFEVAKRELKSGKDISDTEPEKLAKFTTRAHVYHELFKKAKDEFVSEENVTFESLRKFKSKIEKVAKEASSLSNELDG